MAAANPDLPLLETLGQRFDHLVRTVFPASLGRPYTNKEIADAITGMGFEVTDEYIRLLRKDKRERPSFELICKIARFYHIKVDYLNVDESSTEVQDLLDLAAEVRDADSIYIGEICRGLSAGSITVMKTTGLQLRKLEGLDTEGLKTPVPLG